MVERRMVERQKKNDGKKNRMTKGMMERSMVERQKKNDGKKNRMIKRRIMERKKKDKKDGKRMDR